VSFGASAQDRYCSSSVFLFVMGPMLLKPAQHSDRIGMRTENYLPRRHGQFKRAARRRYPIDDIWIGNSLIHHPQMVHRAAVHRFWMRPITWRMAGVSSASSFCRRCAGRVLARLLEHLLRRIEHPALSRALCRSTAERPDARHQPRRLGRTLWGSRTQPWCGARLLGLAWAACRAGIIAECCFRSSTCSCVVCSAAGRC
jgi:hypothetical protein